jgi:hypothetical protein
VLFDRPAATMRAEVPIDRVQHGQHSMVDAEVATNLQTPFAPDEVLFGQGQYH